MTQYEGPHLEEFDLEPGRAGGIKVNATLLTGGGLEFSYLGGEQWTATPDGKFKDAHGRAPERSSDLAKDALKILDKMASAHSLSDSDLKTINHLRNIMKKEAANSPAAGVKERGGLELTLNSEDTFTIPPNPLAGFNGNGNTNAARNDKPYFLGDRESRPGEHDTLLHEIVQKLNYAAISEKIKAHPLPAPNASAADIASAPGVVYALQENSAPQKQSIGDSPEQLRQAVKDALNQETEGHDVIGALRKVMEGNGTAGTPAGKTPALRLADKGIAT